MKRDDMKKFGTMFLTVLVVTLLVAGGLNLSSALAQPPAQQTGEGDSVRTISTSGSGIVSAQPDTAFIVVGVRTEAEEASEALDENSTQMADLLATLRQAGIPQENLQTQFVNLSPRYSNQTTPTGTPEVTGYIATNTVQAQIDDITQVGQILDTAVQGGSNLIENIRFEVNDQQAAQLQAREDAFADARQKAEQLADLAGVTLGQVVSISESTSLPPGPFAAGGRALAADQAVPVEPGTQNIQIDLQVTWQISGNLPPTTRTPTPAFTATLPTSTATQVVTATSAATRTVTQTALPEETNTPAATDEPDETATPVATDEPTAEATGTEAATPTP